MDIHHFDSMSKEDQIQYFWDNSVKVDSYKGEEFDYFLFKDNLSDLYFELSLHQVSEELGLKVMEKSEAQAKYNGTHIKVDKDPWE